ncbi:tetratricopeptide repeat protein [Dankookia rubra]|uniref:Tetratricopeptide repeat protein n=1 Tax=Dankookia rubra TaxID=1442381 RepID=A0A4V3A9L9_9PROT|nr:tetratricopeptide repeat protein [Dankookia rubra]TDH59795.1 tetratricopeptide repeat protein [Dankookia rubra]
MAAAEFRVFLSAVTSEFGHTRSALAADLRSRSLLVRVQDDFRQEAAADTTLRKLHDYIRDCAAVVCIIGSRSGACPPANAAVSFIHMLPSGIAKASYTQWEFFFARHYRRRLSIYIARDNYVPDLPEPNGPDCPELQQVMVHYILQEKGFDRSSFSNEDQLCRAVLKEDWEGRAAARSQNLPYLSLGGLFKGREDVLQALRSRLHRAGGGRAAVTGGAVQGLGGIGKTRAAVEYAWRHYYDYTALLFVIAETPEALRRNLAALAGTPLGLPVAAAAEQDAQLQAVIGWLHSHPGWLLVLDNVDSPEALKAAEAMLGRTAGGQVVMTTRLQNLPSTFAPVRLGVLEPDDATAFLLERTDTRRRRAADDAVRARSLAAELGGLALALEHAGALIFRRVMSFEAYRQMWKGNRGKVLAWSDPAVTHYPREIAVTWQTSVEQLSPAGRVLLERLAWLGPDLIPEALLEVPVPGVETEDDALEALADLDAHSLVTRAELPTFTVHRLVQDVTRRSLASDTAQQRLEEALCWLDAAFTGDPDDFHDWPRLDPLAPHVTVALATADEAGITASMSRLMSATASLFLTKARYAEAEPLMRRALAIDEQNLGPDHPDVAIRLNNLARLLRATNRYAEAEPLMRRALAIDEHSLGPDHPDVAIRLNNLAILLKDTNRLAEAEPLMRRALAIDEHNLGPDHPDTARDLNNLATLLQVTNRLAEAEPLIRRALAIDEHSLGLDHPNVARDLNNLVRLLRATNRLAEAEPLMRRALAISERSLGPDHPNVAIRLNNLALLLRATNRMAEAEPLMRRALAIDEHSFGPDHPDVAIDLYNLARLLQDTNRLTEAEPLMQRLVRILVAFTRITGHSHPHLDTALDNYQALLEKLSWNEKKIEGLFMDIVAPISDNVHAPKFIL